jgi:hypothetical protein
MNAKVILSFLLCLATAQAATLFYDDFSSPEPAKKGWADYSNNPAPNTFEFDNRMLHFPQNMTKSAWLMVGESGWTNIRISFKLRTRFPEGYGLLIIGGRGAMDKAKLDASYAGWALSGEGGLKSMLVAVDTGKETVLGSVTPDLGVLEMDTWHDVVVEVGASSIRVMIDGKEFQSADGTLPAAGRLVIANGFGAETWIKNLKVESL